MWSVKLRIFLNYQEKQKQDLNLADMTADNQWVCCDDHQSEPPVQDKGNDECSNSQTNILQENWGAIYDHTSQQSCIGF